MEWSVVYDERGAELALKTNEDLEGALRRYLLLMDEEEFFEAHEVLEEAWHPFRKRKDPLSDPLKGLINAAVAFEHLKRGKPGAEQRARSVMSSYDRRCRGDRKDRPEAELFMQAYHKVNGLKEQYRDIFDVLVP